MSAAAVRIAAPICENAARSEIARMRYLLGDLDSCTTGIKVGLLIDAVQHLSHFIDSVIEDCPEHWDRVIDYVSASNDELARVLAKLEKEGA
jgi:hypothetical protein